MSEVPRQIVDAARHVVARDAQETATVLFNMVGQTYAHLRTGHGWLPTRTRDGVMALIMTGVLARR